LTKTIFLFENCFLFFNVINQMISHSFNDPTLINSDPTVKNSTAALFRYPCKTLYSCSSYTITLESGEYLLEVWGGSGATGSSGNNWKTGGGYSSGILKAKERLTFYLFLGSSPTNGANNGGYNGGGNDNHDFTSGGGGGATDFRTINGSSWSNEASLKSRFLVAGGSGGGHQPSCGRGGYGGGEVAWDSLDDACNKGSFATYHAEGGSQTHGGQGATYGSYCESGTFGIGGLGYDGGGGGGLWGFGGGGGSSFAYHSKSQILPAGYSVSDAFLLYNHSLLTGNQTYPTYSGGCQTGTFDNGAARTTYLQKYKENICIRSCKQYRFEIMEHIMLFFAIIYS
jgi:hypothetical protein